MHRRHFLSLALAMPVLPAMAATSASVIAFDAQWRTLNFRSIRPTDYSAQGTRLAISAERSSSIFYRSVPEDQRNATKARWSWNVTESVPPTDLRKRGGDDRNLAIYFVFMDEAAAANVGPDTSIMRLMANRSARILIYVWGGEHEQRAFVPNPYMSGRGVSIVLHTASTGRFSEAVDFKADLRRAFGSETGALVGIAVSSDSDDTERTVKAELRDLTIF